ncbi:META domain-containing protein [Emticicia sp. BO119]|uniref:META domain-containing protein n=1 Tax=Emticicia sp. BO119 TaxID=2757768 RepID=UPI0015F01BBC|nr:META domain-containing protein [Emticicia sp. BO119]MBA4853330.1 META domain-containing protein [Emticicia sp. BO119]
MKNIVLIIGLFSYGMLGCIGTQTTSTTTQKPSDAINTSMKLNGSWELADIPGARVSVAGLYPVKKPVITFDVNDNKFVGNTSCNNFSGLLVVYGNKINFNKSMAMTKMACQGEGEPTFIDALKKIDSFTINGDNTLSLNSDGIEILRMVKVTK